MKRLSTSQKKMAINITIILASLLLMLYLISQAGDLGEMFKAFQTVHLGWLLGALGCFTAHVLLEGISLFLFFRYQQVNVSLGACEVVGLIGIFYSNITPAATGGQPMQVFSLKKRGVPPGVASSALAVKFFCWQCALLAMGGVFWLIHPGFVHSILGNGVWLVALGFFFNSLMVAAVILLAISRNLVRAVIIFFVNLAYRLKLTRDVAKTSSRWDAALNDFHASVEILTTRPWQFLSLLGLGLMQVSALMSVIYFVYRGFGLMASPYYKILSIQLLLYITASFTPLPGASGAQEGGFYVFFNPFFPEGTLLAALLVWRFITYYLFILVGFVAVVIDQALGARRIRKEQAALRERLAEEDLP